MRNLSGNFFPEDNGLCFRGINLAGALLALGALHSGVRVTICLDKPVSRELEPELVTLYPLNLMQLPRAITNLRVLEKIASFYPSLIYPQRILTISVEKKFNPRIVAFIDFVLKRDREEASLPIRFSNFQQYKLFDGHFRNGVLFHEFRFDRNMLLFYLLHECCEKGAEILGNENAEAESVNRNITVNCIEGTRSKRRFTIDGAVDLPNNLRLVSRYFEATVQKTGEKNSISFRFKRLVDEAVFLNEASNIVKSLGIDTPEIYHNELRSVYKLANEKPATYNKNLIVVPDSELDELPALFSSFEKRLLDVSSRKIALWKWFSLLKGIQLKGEHFRLVQTVCDEKFDLAKQTGIEYSQFCYYYFRYSLVIDELIEQAYEQLDAYRSNPELNWATIETKYLDSLEKKIFC